uniref:Uncharacterized protein n=1 Tax=Rhodosorus marinus TaxID=101924 RepID=A0A7S3EF46_9RHOD|mmetsp:Transcript_28939/g.112616  ORF Transcript_28939/g.112616 Transcript_28939/m.112616 type:complete len:281 (+) Transcript_28939:127-969(+)|eukprot:CAMPEP_0113966504 /NCGR_PEP_ID=MMETSP0011_2-20120614/8364_1 /TAXON_ID=101924 /ORGANISM="Rhodosorus marinus" /LENGTH=280 /DNA_ID=CAMNT_0000979189 /DNA_START=292 /DNA_END=1134 /DNA_ORIENTATION=- /assembly_acc=CAM_ASM_000156
MEKRKGGRTESSDSSGKRSKTKEKVKKGGAKRNGVVQGPRASSPNETHVVKDELQMQRGGPVYGGFVQHTGETIRARESSWGGENFGHYPYTYAGDSRGLYLLGAPPQHSYVLEGAQCFGHTGKGCLCAYCSHSKAAEGWKNHVEPQGAVYLTKPVEYAHVHPVMVAETPKMNQSMMHARDAYGYPRAEQYQYPAQMRTESNRVPLPALTMDLFGDRISLLMTSEQYLSDVQAYGHPLFGPMRRSSCSGEANNTGQSFVLYPPGMGVQQGRESIAVSTQE